MNKGLRYVLLFFVVIAVSAVSFSFTTASDPTANTTSISNIEFKITNDTGSEFKYCVNGGHNYISSGSTKSFSYSEGQDFYHIDGSNCGKLWFEVKSSMQGKSYKLSDLR